MYSRRKLAEEHLVFVHAILLELRGKKIAAWKEDNESPQANYTSLTFGLFGREIETSITQSLDPTKLMNAHPYVLFNCYSKKKLIKSDIVLLISLIILVFLIKYE